MLAKKQYKTYTNTNFKIVCDDTILDFDFNLNVELLKQVDSYESANALFNLNSKDFIKFVFEDDFEFEYKAQKDNNLWIFNSFNTIYENIKSTGWNSIDDKFCYVFNNFIKSFNVNEFDGDFVGDLTLPSKYKFMIKTNKIKSLYLYLRNFYNG